MRSIRKVCLFLSLFLTLVCSGNSAIADESAAININTADAATLATGLKGVGPSKAEAIISYRESYGPFKAVEELAAVKGIGESLISQNRDKIILE